MIRILFSIILLLFFDVRSRTEVLSSYILLFTACKSFRRIVFSSAIGVIIFLIICYFSCDFLLLLLVPLQNMNYHNLFCWTPTLDCYTFPWLLLGFHRSWFFFDGILVFVEANCPGNCSWCHLKNFYHCHFGVVLGRHLISCIFHDERV